MAEVAFTREQFWSGLPTDQLIAWVEFAGVDATGASQTFVWSAQVAAHPSSYHGGYKDGRMLTWGFSSRALSNFFDGQFNGFTFSFTLSDVDNTLRAWLVNSYQRYIANREVVIRVITRAQADAGLQPKVLARGIVTRYAPASDGSWTFECTDILSFRFREAVPRRRTTDGSIGMACASQFQGLVEPIVYGGWISYTCGVYVGQFAGKARWLVAGHACKAITAAELTGSDGVPVDKTASLGGSWDVHLAEVINGRTYCYIDIDDAGDIDAIIGGAVVFLTMEGIEDVGDGSGTTIDEFMLQYCHFMQNWVFEDYQTGQWPSVADTWFKYDGGTLEVVDAQSFIDGNAEWAAENFVAHIGTWSVHEETDPREQVAKLNLSCGLQSGIRRNGQYFVTLPRRGAFATAPIETITETQDIKDGSFNFEDYPSGGELVNTINYKSGPWGKHPHPRAPWEYANTEKNSTSIANDRTVVARDLELLSWDAGNGGFPAVLQLHLLYGAKTRQTSLTSGLYFLNYELGQVFSVTHRFGPGPSGFVDEPHVWEQEVLDLNTEEVAMTLVECATATPLVGLQSRPESANGVSVTPSATPNAESAWTEFVASTPDVWYLSALTALQGGYGDGLYVLTVGIGGAGSETPVAEIASNSDYGAPYGLHNLALPVAYGPIPAGTRVAVRLRKDNADTTAWRIGMRIYEGGLPANVPVTQQRLLASAITSLTPPGSAWADGAWAELVASSGGAVALAYLAINRNSNSANDFRGEFDLGVGAAAAEVVACTLPHTQTGLFFSPGPGYANIWPLRAGIASGSRVAARVRVDDASVLAKKVILGYYEDLEVSVGARVATSLTQQVYPAAAAPMTLDSENVEGTENTPSWAEVFASATNDLAFTGFSIDGWGDKGIIDIAVGADGFEQVIDSWIVDAGTGGISTTYRRPITRVIQAGSRVTVRLRSDAVTDFFSPKLKLAYIENPTFATLGAAAHVPLPDVVTSPSPDWIELVLPDAGSDWAPGSIVEVADDAYSATPWFLTAFIFRPQNTNGQQEAELEFFLGASGEEQRYAVYRVGGGFAAGIGGLFAADAPLRIPASTRLSARVRNVCSGTRRDYVFIGEALAA